MSVRLESPRLVLRVPVETDLDGWAMFDSDPRATAFFGGTKNRGQAWEMLASNAGMWSLRGCGLFSVFEKATEQWVGRVGPWKPEGATAEIGWAILPSHWGRGYATEAAATAINWVIDHLQWVEIVHCIDADNAPSIAVAHRLGAKWLRVGSDAHGKETQVYGQTAERWRAR